MRGLIRAGARSTQVSDVQARLRSLGFEVDDDSGVFGESTERAVRAFQQRRGIVIDGLVGPHTWNELVEASWRLGDRVLYLKHPMLRGDDVLLLQRRLNALGFDAGREDGIFGRATAEAVKAFQQEYGIAEDGIYGTLTHIGLEGLRVDRPATAAALREQLKRSQYKLHDALIVIDAAHGGSDPGALGPNGAAEADVCWDLALRVAGQLTSWGPRVRFSRTEAEAPDASERARRANALGADLLVSLHLDPQSDEDPAPSAYHFVSSSAGAALAESLRRELSAAQVAVCQARGRSYPLLRETRMPAVILEPLFIAHGDDEKRLEDAHFRATLAAAVCSGIRRYFDDAQ